MEELLTAAPLDVGYPGKTVISGVNLHALRGQVICLLGPNGAGKSTILRTISGLLAPREGIVEIESTDIRSINKKALARKLSLVLTDAVSPALTTVWQLLSLGRTPYTDFLGRLTEEDKTVIREALQTVGAENLRDRYYCELSDGEKQKVMIARALVQEPELMILDEPTSHLDIKHKVEVIRVLQKLANEKHITCILSLHDIDLALKGCQTVLLVHDGKVVAQGTPEDIVEDGMIGRLYDMTDAEYNERYGSIELKGWPGTDLFVVGGCGTGTRLYRALSRMGWGLASGVLHENDRDYPIAKTICTEVISEEAFEPVSSQALDRAEALMQSCRMVVDAGFPVGSGNRGNRQLLLHALEQNMPVFTLRSPEDCRTLFGELAGGLRPVSSMEALFAAIKQQEV